MSKGKMRIEFKLKNDYIELNKLLKITGCCETGGMAKALVADGLVNVDGCIEHRKRRKIRKGQVVQFSDQRIVVV